MFKALVRDNIIEARRGDFFDTFSRWYRTALDLLVKIGYMTPDLEFLTLNPPTT